MVYQQQPGAQPAAPQPTYGQAPAPAGQYGAPAPGQPAGQPIGAMPPAEIKWSGLETGGSFHLPVVAFIGRLTDIIEDASSQFGLRIVEKFDQVQILNSPVPWPWATIDPSIKYSAKENSAWGKHIASAKALGLAINATTLAEARAELVGKVYEMVQAEEAYGQDKATGEPMKGDVWRFVRIVQPGQAAAFPQPQYAAPQPAVTGQTAQSAVQQTPAALASPAAQPAAAVAPQLAPVAQPEPAPAATPAVTPSVAFSTAIDPADTAPIRAKKLLHGKALNEWLGAALIDDKIKGDPSFINTIYDQSFIVGLKASGQVTQEQDGKFTVTA